MSITETNHKKLFHQNSLNSSSTSSDKKIFIISKEGNKDQNKEKISKSSIESTIKKCYFSSRFNEKNKPINCISSVKASYPFKYKQSLNKGIIREFRRYLSKSKLSPDIMNIKLIKDFIDNKISPPFEYEYEYILYDIDYEIDNLTIEYALSGNLIKDKVSFKSYKYSYLIWLFDFKIIYYLFAIFIHDKYENLLNKLKKNGDKIEINENICFYLKNFHEIFKNSHLFLNLY